MNLAPAMEIAVAQAIAAAAFAALEIAVAVETVQCFESILGYTYYLAMEIHCFAARNSPAAADYRAFAEASLDPLEIAVAMEIAVAVETVPYFEGIFAMNLVAAMEIVAAVASAVLTHYLTQQAHTAIHQMR